MSWKIASAWNRRRVPTPSAAAGMVPTGVAAGWVTVTVVG